MLVKIFVREIDFRNLYFLGTDRTAIFLRHSGHLSPEFRRNSGFSDSDLRRWMEDLEGGSLSRLGSELPFLEVWMLRNSGGREGFFIPLGVFPEDFKFLLNFGFFWFLFWSYPLGRCLIRFGFLKICFFMMICVVA